MVTVAIILAVLLVAYAGWRIARLPRRRRRREPTDTMEERDG